MRRVEMVLLVIVALLAGALVYARERYLNALLDKHNAEAARDSSRVVFRDSLHTVSERLAFEQTNNISLSGDQKKLLSVNHQQTQMIANLRVALDSLSEVVSHGTVTLGADTTLRLLAASLDTAGFHVRLHAEVPAPPHDATLHWNISRDPVEIAAALNRDAEGREALRAYAGQHETIRIDTVRARITSGLGRTQKLALPLGGILIGFILRGVLR